MRSIVLSIAIAIALAAGCSSPTAPTSSLPAGPRSGTWNGALSDGSNGQGTVRVVLIETLFGGQGLLAGTWTTTFADPSKNATGDVSGIVNGSVVQLRLGRTTPLVCPNPGPVTAAYGSFLASNLAVAGTTISGAYDYQTCTTAASGTLQLTRQ